MTDTPNVRATLVRVLLVQFVTLCLLGAMQWLWDR